MTTNCDLFILYLKVAYDAKFTLLMISNSALCL